MSRSGGRWTLPSLGGVIAVDQLHGYAFVVLAPEIARSLDTSTTTLAVLGLARGAGFALAGGAVGAAVARGAARRVTRWGAGVRAGALVAGAAAAPVAVTGALAVYGAAGASGATAHRRLLPASAHETHRLVGRLGNAVVALVIGLLAVALSWPSVFIVLAVVAALAAASTLAIPAAPLASLPGDEEVDRLAAVPGGRGLLAVVAACALVEFPMYIVVFTHLGEALRVGPLGRALVIGGAEAVGVVANLALGRRLRGARSRSAAGLGVAVAAAVIVSFGALIVALSVRTLPAAVVALCVSTVVMSATVPLLVLGTRAVLAGVVPRRVSFVTTAALAAVLLLVPADDAGLVAVLAILPLWAGLWAARVSTRSPAAVADALRGVANVTAEARMPVGDVALTEA